jgi:hypothetical protein
MRDKRAIIIKSPQLQRVRNGFRNLLLKINSEKWNKIFDEMDKLRFDSNGIRRTIDDFSEDEIRQYRIFQKEQAGLRNVADRSICKCITCGASDRDMIYNRSYDAWYCIQCYGIHHNSARQWEVRKTQRDEDKAMDELSKSFL